MEYLNATCYAAYKTFFINSFPISCSKKDYLDSDLEDDDDESSIKTDGLDMSTTVTIVEEDGTTSVVDDASIVTEDSPNNPIQFGQSSSMLLHKAESVIEEVKLSDHILN